VLSERADQWSDKFFNTFSNSTLFPSCSSSVNSPDKIIGAPIRTVARPNGNGTINPSQLFTTTFHDTSHDTGIIGAPVN